MSNISKTLKEELKNISRPLEEQMKDLKFMRNMGWYCDQRNYYEMIEEDNKIKSRFEILDL